MNQEIKRALHLAAIGILSVAHAVAQSQNWDPNCIDPNNSAPYSIPFLTDEIGSQIWLSGIGLAGTCAYKYCVSEANGASVPVTGRFEFASGSDGSIQDEQDPALGFSDNYLMVNYGSNIGFGLTSGSGWSYARILETKAGATTSTFFGNKVTLAFSGASNRYYYFEDDETDFDAAMICDVIGDAARFTWNLKNNTATPLSLGVEVAQIVIMDPLNQGFPGSFPSGPFFITAPGMAPITTPETFSNNPQVSTTLPPDYIDFAFTQAAAYGLEITNGPTSNTEDQYGNSDVTPVDQVALGNAIYINPPNGFNGGITNPIPGGFSFPDQTILGDTAYLQTWNPAPVAAGAARQIVSYYRSTWGASSYGAYTAVVDAPHVVRYDPAAPQSEGYLTPNPIDIRVDVDNTGHYFSNPNEGFGEFTTPVTMNNVRVTLQLSQGMSDVNNPNSQTMVQQIGAIQPVSIGTADFNVQVQPGVSGDFPYTVTIEPNPGTTKVISGVIKVGDVPQLQVVQGANLVTLPWQFDDSTWATILSPLQADVQYQAFNYDNTVGQYVVSTNAARGVGTWILSNTSVLLSPLAGFPVQPPDEFPSGGAVSQLQVHLTPGWNLIGDPYNYSVPLSQLVGIPDNTTEVLSWGQMLGSYVGSTVSYWDPYTQNYSVLIGTDPAMQPNFGYWVYASQGLTLQFPPVNLPFARTIGNTSWFQSIGHWKMQLQAQTASSVDSYNYVGVDANGNEAAALRGFKPPLPPTSNALRLFLTDNTGRGVNQYDQAFRSSFGRQTWFAQVYNQRGGTTTVSWPNIATLPRNLAVQITDVATGKVINPRATASYSYISNRNQTRVFSVATAPVGLVALRIGLAQAFFSGRGTNRQVAIRYDLSDNAQTNIVILRNGKPVYTLFSGRIDSYGMNSAVWNCDLFGDQPVPAGQYVVQITSQGEGGGTSQRSLIVNVGP